MKIHIAYTLSETKPALHTEFHGNRFSRSPVMPAQTDRQTKKNFKNVIFVFSTLNYTCWYDLFLKNRKLQEILGLQIYIYKDYHFEVHLMAFCVEENMITKDDFTVESRVNFKLFHNPVREYMARSTVISLQFMS